MRNNSIICNVPILLVFINLEYTYIICFPQGLIRFNFVVFILYIKTEERKGFKMWKNLVEQYNGFFKLIFFLIAGQKHYIET